MTLRAIRILSLASAIGLAAACSGGPRAAIEQLLESRRLAAELLLQLTKLTEAGNRAVMADTDDSAAVAVRESAASRAAIERDTAALTVRLTDLGYDSEKTALSEFQKLFADLGGLDRDILDLAALDTNLKAQRLSFGQAFASADAVRDALASVRGRSSAPPDDDWQVRALVAETMSGVREIQALQAPHISEADDAAMTKLEARMKKAETAAREALKALAPLAGPESGPNISTASAQLDAFMSVHARILELSRLNSNVRSLALVLGRRRTLAAACEERLRTVQEALAKRAVGPTR